MKAHELREGDEYRTESGVQITVIRDAVEDGVSTTSGVMQVCVIARFRDGGTAPRWFDADDEVPYTRPEKR
jgi:hypothetical protein